MALPQDQEKNKAQSAISYGGMPDFQAMGIPDPRDVAQQLFQADQNKQERAFQESAKQVFARSKGRITPAMLLGGRLDPDKMIDEHFDISKEELEKLTPTEQAEAYASMAAINATIKEHSTAAGDGKAQSNDAYAGVKSSLIGKPEGMSDEEIDELAQRMFGNNPTPQFASFNDVNPNARGFLIGMGIGRVVQGGLGGGVSDFSQMSTAATAQVQQEMNQRYLQSKQAADNDAAKAKFIFDAKNDRYQKDANWGNTINQGILALQRTQDTNASRERIAESKNETTLRVAGIKRDSILMGKVVDLFGKDRNEISPEDWANTANTYKAIFSDNPAMLKLLDDFSGDPRELTPEQANMIALQGPKIRMYEAIASANLSRGRADDAKAGWYTEQAAYISQRYALDLAEFAEKQRQYEQTQNFNTAQSRYDSAEKLITNAKNALAKDETDLATAKTNYQKAFDTVKALRTGGTKPNTQEGKLDLASLEAQLPALEQAVAIAQKRVDTGKRILYGSFGMKPAVKDPLTGMVMVPPMETFGDEERPVPGSLQAQYNQAAADLEGYQDAPDMSRPEPMRPDVTGMGLPQNPNAVVGGVNGAGVKVPDPTKPTPPPTKPAPKPTVAKQKGLTRKAG